MNRIFHRTAIAGVLALAIAGPAAAQDDDRLGGAGQDRMQADSDRDQRNSPRVERFMRLYDMDGDGRITVEEINSDQARMFGALDIDDDKSLSVAEMQRRGRSLQLWRTVTMFDLLDVNGDGSISVEEIQAPTRRWFSRYDANKNGVLEAEELPARRWSRHRGRR